jgi:hypothetical protein
MSERLRVPIGSVAKRLGELERAESVEATAKEHESELERLIYEGFGELIERFNQINRHAPILEIMPKVKVLKNILDDIPIPKLEQITSRDLVSGIKEAAPLILMGQQIKRKELSATEKNIELAIGTPSMDTNDMALAVGTAGHILERSFFSYMRRVGVKHDWKRDELLFALEDIALLKHAESQRWMEKEAILFDVITAPNSMSSEGGLGWRKQDKVAEFVEKYNLLVDNIR